MAVSSERRFCECIEGELGREKIISPVGEAHPIKDSGAKDRWKYCPWCGGCIRNRGDIIHDIWAWLSKENDKPTAHHYKMFHKTLAGKSDKVLEHVVKFAYRHRHDKGLWARVTVEARICHHNEREEIMQMRKTDDQIAMRNLMSVVGLQ